MTGRPYVDQRGRTVEVGCTVQWVRGKNVADGTVVSIGRKNVRIRRRGHKQESLVPRGEVWRFAVADYVPETRRRGAR